MKLQTFVISPIGSNCYVLYEEDRPGAEAVVIDPGDTALQPVFDFIDSRQLKVKAVWNTHAHFDHVMGVDLVRDRYDVPAYLHKADLPVWNSVADVTQKWLGRTVSALRSPDSYWEDGDTVTLGAESWTVWHTPGHSPGSVCLIGREWAFTGDTLFAGSIGRTDFPGSSPADMEASLKRLLTLPDHLVVYPGHMQPSDVGRERRTNPFLRAL